MDPIETINKRTGDCDEISLAYLSTMYSLGIRGIMQCTDTHCYDIIFIDGKKYKVDVVNYIFEEIN